MRARAAAETAMRRAGVSVLEIDSTAEARRAADLLREVWRSAQEPVPLHMLRAVRHAGGYLFGAYDETGALLAVSIGLLAAEGLHSHITGVVPVAQRRGLGFALKQHQRLWALNHGMTTIGWTVDPLVRRNVAFNLHALGAVVTRYLPDFYGSMDDGVNKGDVSDRFALRWDLLSPAALQAGEGRLPFVERGDSMHRVAVGPDRLPVSHDVDKPRRLVALPSDIEALRRVDAAGGLAWRHAVREAIMPALSAGAAVLGMTSTGELVLEDQA